MKEPTGAMGEYLRIEDGLSPELPSKWSDLVNRSEAEMIANRAVLEEIWKAVAQESPGLRVSELLWLAQTTAVTAYNGKKHGVTGRRKLLGPDMTVADLLERVPIYQWPPAGGNGCFSIGCVEHDIAKEDHPQRAYRLIQNQKMVEECVQ
jgi:hypothetical protein